MCFDRLGGPPAGRKTENFATTARPESFALTGPKEIIMADDSTVTICASFSTREAADLAVEHLVQQQGISRPDIFVQAATGENTSGSRASGGDASHEDGTRHDGALDGDIEVSVDIVADQIAAVQRIFGDVGAMRVSKG
jgi:hypothetical protein